MGCSPSVQQSRKVLQLLSCFYMHLLEAYTNVDFTLHQQLTHLLAAAHLVLAFYAKEKGHAMTSQLFFDLMTTIKNAYVCVGKTQVHHPQGSFWLSLPGTNSLKGLFGKVQTIQGNDSNVDQLQLANHIDSAVICTNILEEHLEWE